MAMVRSLHNFYYEYTHVYRAKWCGRASSAGGGDALWLDTDSAELLLDRPTPAATK